MPPRHNPRRNVGAPVRFEDDETYLSERPRDPTKPAWPKLLAQSTVPYNPALPPVACNTRTLDQTFVQISEQAPNGCDEPKYHDHSEHEAFSEQLKFLDYHDLDMATSESEGGDGDERQESVEVSQHTAPIVPNWSSLDPALQLSMYEYIYQFLQNQDRDKFGLSQENSSEIRAEAGELLGLDKDELADMECQRAFRLNNPLTEDYLQGQWLKAEREMIMREDLLSKNASEDRKKRREMNNSYIAFMVHISKYKYTKESAMDFARAYVKARGLKPKVVGEWTQAEEETTMMLASTKAADSSSPLLLPAMQCLVMPPDAQVLPCTAVPGQHSASHPPQESSVSLLQTQASPQPRLSLPKIKSKEDFATRHDPKFIEPPKYAGLHQRQRGREPICPSDLLMKVNVNGRAEIRKKPSKRRAASELRQSYPDETLTGVRVVVLENGQVGFDTDTQPTPEVESLLRTGIDASRRGYAIGLKSQLHNPARLPSSAAKARPRRFSDVLLGINSDHMPASISSGFATDDGGGPPLTITSTPPQPAWSPIASLDCPASPSPTKCAAKVPNANYPSSPSTENTLQPLRSVQSQVKMQLTESQIQEYPPLPFDVRNDALGTNEAKENLDPAATSSRQYNRSSSTPLMFPDAVNDHDSGIGSSRATSTEPDIAKHEKTAPRKQPQQVGKHKVTQLNRKTGKGARGGTGAYNTKRKAAEKEMAAAGPLPLAEKTNANTTRSTNYAA